MSRLNDQDPTTAKWGRAVFFVARAPSLLGALTLFALMAMTFADVLMRSVLNAPIEAATELTRLFMAIIVFSSLPAISWRAEHITVDLLDGFFSRSAARLRDSVVDLGCAAALTWPAWRVWQLALRAREDGAVTEYLGIPQFYIAMFIAVSALVSVLLLIVRAVLHLAAPQLLPTKDKLPLPLD